MNRTECIAKIPGYETKAKILREDGWVTYMSEDNWVKREWMEQGRPYEWMGHRTERAKNWSKYSAVLAQETRQDNGE